jgi:hypothetical protein
MAKLGFKQFVEGDIENWLLGRQTKDRHSIIPPVGKSPEELLTGLEHAEKSGDPIAIQKARASIEANGYNVRLMRQLVPKYQRRRAAK